MSVTVPPPPEPAVKAADTSNPVQTGPAAGVGESMPETGCGSTVMFTVKGEPGQLFAVGVMVYFSTPVLVLLNV